MPTEEPTHAVLAVDVAHGGHNAKPGTGIFSKLGVGGLEEDFDTVEGADDSFGLGRRLVSGATMSKREEDHTAHPANPPASPVLKT